MKSFFLFLAFIAMLASNLKAAPTLSVADAVAIAQADLASRGLEASVYIALVSYKKGALGTPEHWEVLWSSQFDAQTEGRKEIGLRITMDGNYKRSVR